MKVGLRSRRVVTEQGTRPATVILEDDKIIEVVEEAPPGLDVEDLDDLVVMPGLVDSHVHVNEPGRTEWEGFETATRAAAKGGITTIVDMPLNCTPVTTTLEAFELKLEACAPLLHVDAAFWGGVIPGNSGELAAMAERGMAGAKAFLCHSGIDDFPNATREDLRAAMPILAAANIPLLVHAELIDREPTPLPLSNRDYARYLASRPARWEEDAIDLVIDLVRKTGCGAHIVHLSAASALPALAAARSEGLPITVETCPHYLCLTAEEVPDGETAFKCAPPIREGANREGLWEGLRDRTIDLVVSDHSPCTPELKRPETGDFMGAWGGIASLQLGLTTIWTEASRRGFGFEELVRWMSSEPARLAGLGDRKGALAPGYDADIIAWDPDAETTIEPAAIEHRHKVTPYLGRRGHGVVRHTWLRGAKIVDSGEVVGPPRGVPLFRNRT